VSSNSLILLYVLDDFARKVVYVLPYVALMIRNMVGTNSNAPMTTNLPEKALEQGTTTSTTPIFESLARISLAAFGGGLAGFSILRRRGSFGTMTDSVLGRRSMDAQTHNAFLSASPSSLPITWAIGCTTFAGIVEFSSLASPTSLILDGVRYFGLLESAYVEEEDAQNVYTTLNNMKSSNGGLLSWDENCTRTLGDFALGGGIAGAVFKGNHIRDALPNYGGNGQFKTTAIRSNYNLTGTSKQKRMIGRGRVVSIAERRKPASSSSLQSTSNAILRNGTRGMIPPIVKPKTGIIVGILPGLFLGILAGLIQITLNNLSAITERNLNNENQEVDNTEV